MDQTNIQRRHYANGSLKVSKLSLTTINFKLFTSNKKAEKGAVQSLLCWLMNKKRFCQNTLLVYASKSD